MLKFYKMGGMNMFKQLAWLWVAILLVAGAIGTTPSYAGDTSSDRHMAPNEGAQNLVKILRTTNKAQVNSYVPVVFTMRNVNPFAVIRYLRAPIQLEEGLLFTFATPDGYAGKVLYCVPEYMVESLAELVETLDRPQLSSADGRLRQVRHLKHRRAHSTDQGFLDTAESYLTKNGTFLLADGETNMLIWGDAPSGSASLGMALDDFLDVPTASVQVVIKVYELDATNDATIGLDYMAWKNDLGANLFAVGAHSEYASFGRGASSALIDPLGTGARGLPANNFQSSGWNYAYEYSVSSAFFDYLAVKGKARILNQMKLAALNTYPAVLTAGDQILYYAVSTSDPSGVRDTGRYFGANGARVMIGTPDQIVTTDPESLNEALLNLGLSVEDAARATLNNQALNAINFNNLNFNALNQISLRTSALEPVETGLRVEVRPVIGVPTDYGDTPTVNLDLAMEWSDFTGFDDAGFPQINTRELSSNVRMAIGEEMVIGGLERETMVRTTRKIPILGSIPVIGYLFGGESSQTRKSELVVSVQPIDVMDYKISKMDQRVIDQAMGAEIAEPATRWGFDMATLDKEYRYTE